MLASLVFVSMSLAQAQPALPFVSPVFSDHMVLQRGIEPPIWGWTTPNTTVKVHVGQSEVTCRSGVDGKWLARLPKLKVGGPYTITVEGREKVTLKDVLVGDVWICSGQSNMEQGIGACNDAEKEIANANHPNIRLFLAPKVMSLKPETIIQGTWRICSPENVARDGWGGFSGAAYYFGRQLQKNLNVPIGLINTCWGGTVAEAWTSGEALNTLPDFKRAVKSVLDLRNHQNEAAQRYNIQLAAWFMKHDIGSRAPKPWFALDLDDSRWLHCGVETGFEANTKADFDGIAWYRLTIDVPEAAAGKAARLKLGMIDDMDTTWVNGSQVGQTNGWSDMRDYAVPAGLLKAGKNVIAVRVLDNMGEGGMRSGAGVRKLEIADQAPISLDNGWLLNAAVALPKADPVPEKIDFTPNTPTALYNAMIHPFLPFGIKGAIWYQGESNADRAYQYRDLLPTMIQDWRTRFEVGNFPFLIVQLANFMQTAPQPVEDAWAELREAQNMAAKKAGNAAVAVIIDAGDANDIHPKDKQTVGYRLAMAAQQVAYGKKGDFLSPEYLATAVKGNEVMIDFQHVGKGLESHGTEIKGFAIAGEDRKFVWAKARIEGSKVVVWSPDVAKPVAVRYAWGCNPICNLYNKAGLPVSPFRTDTWPGLTAKNH